jgi:hypothetical protein
MSFGEFALQQHSFSHCLYALLHSLHKFSPASPPTSE